jgi:hypothetical protein
LDQPRRSEGLVTPPVRVATAGATLYRITRRVVFWSDELMLNYPKLMATAILILATLMFAASESRRPMWEDELFTYYIATQSTAREAIQATLEGCDNAPPLYALITRPLLNLLPTPAFALRLPSVFGSLLMGACVFSLSRRRVSPVYAIAAMLAALVSSSASGLDARPYGLTLGCAALALLAWQSAAEGRRRTLALSVLYLGLTSAIALQYYSVFLLVPLACGELVRWWKFRKFDFWVLAILICCPLVLIPHRTLMLAGLKVTTYFWSRASWLQALTTEWEFAWKAVVGLVIAFTAYYFWNRWARTFHAHSVNDCVLPSPPFHETIACVTLAALPILIVSAAMMSTHIFVDRYANPALIGLNILLVVLVARMTGESKLMGVCLVLAFLTLFAAVYGRRAIQAHRMRKIEVAQVDLMLETVPARPIPIVVAQREAFIELWYYHPELRPRLVFPLDLELERRYNNVDTEALILSALRHRTSYRVPDYDTFIKATPTFFLCGFSSDWMKWEMLRSGLRLRPLARSGFGSNSLELYEVTHVDAVNR